MLRKWRAGLIWCHNNDIYRSYGQRWGFQGLKETRQYVKHKMGGKHIGKRNFSVIPHGSKWKAEGSHRGIGNVPEDAISYDNRSSRDCSETARNSLQLSSKGHCLLSASQITGTSHQPCTSGKSPRLQDNVWLCRIRSRSSGLWSYRE